MLSSASGENMGVYREDGYSASVEGFLVFDCTKYRLAKTNGETFVLAESCRIPPRSAAILLVIVDGDEKEDRIFLPNGIACGDRVVKYTCLDTQDVPF